MSSSNWLVLERQRVLLTQARQRRQARQVKELRRASRRAAAAADRLSRAQADLWRLRGRLDADQ